MDETLAVTALLLWLWMGHVGCGPRNRVAASFLWVPSCGRQHYGCSSYPDPQRAAVWTAVSPFVVPPQHDDSGGRTLPFVATSLLAAKNSNHEASDREPARQSTKSNDVRSSKRRSNNKRPSPSDRSPDAHQRTKRNPAARKTSQLDTNVSSYTIRNQVPPRTKDKRNVLSPTNPVLYPFAPTSAPTKSDPPLATQSYSYAPLPTPSVEVQLSLAREGHAVLRQWLSPYQPQLWQLRHLLQAYCQRHELQAWRQKVEVAADNDSSKSSSSTTTTRLPVSSSLQHAQQLAASCRTVHECQTQLHRLLGSTDPTAAVSLPFLQFFNTWRHHPPVLALAQALAEPAAILLNVPSVRLYQDAVFWKRGKQQPESQQQPSDGPTPWHADARLAPFDTSRMLTFWIPLQSVVTSSGLIFCSQSHADFALPFWHDPGNHSDDSPWSNLEERYGGDAALVDYMPLRLGDVTVHAGWTLHCADPVDPDNNSNSKDDDRWALAVTFVDARARIRSDALTSARGDREDAWSYRDWVHDVPTTTTMTNAGRWWDHPLVPILWPPSKVAPSLTKQQQPHEP